MIRGNEFVRLLIYRYIHSCEDISFYFVFGGGGEGNPYIGKVGDCHEAV